MDRSRIVIIGGGFAGVRCARLLRRRLSSESYEVVLFNRENHLVFHPLLAEVVGAAIDPSVPSAPLRPMLPGVRCYTANIVDVDIGAREVVYETGESRRMTMAFDRLVIASGLRANLHAVPGMADHAFALKTVGDALALRTHVLEQIEAAELTTDPERRRWHLSFVVVGGGFSGAEVAGEINDLVRSSLHYYHGLVEADVSVALVHGHPEILPDVGPKLREFARRRMERAKIRFVLGDRVSLATQEGVTLRSGTKVTGATVVSTVGNEVMPFIERIALPKERGRIMTQPDLRVVGRDDIWAIGDCARVVNSVDGSISPPSAQFAERQGYQAAANIVRLIRGQPTKPFRYRQLGQLCAIGGRQAVAEMCGLRLSGFLAWFLWRSVYLFKLPTWSRRVKVAFDWTWELFFARELSHLKVDRTGRISHAFFNAGDYVFREGDPSTSFYSIEKGEVDILRPGATGAPQDVVGVLGPGDFFGEMALLQGHPHRRSVRARTPLDVVILGKSAFDALSCSITALRKFLLATIRKRTDLWQHLPRAHGVLEGLRVADFLEELPAPPLRVETSAWEAVREFSRRSVDFFFVVNDAEELAGVVTRTDLLRILQIASSQGDGAKGLTITIKDVMSANPVAVAIDDASVLVVAALRDHGLKKLPVVATPTDRRLRGYVRLERILDLVLESLRTEDSARASEGQR